MRSKDLPEGGGQRLPLATAERLPRRTPRAATHIHAALRADIVQMRLRPLDILNE
ncbi:MAG: hypothetical protein QE284_19475 [Rhizobium sp.]|nr:hypothetical protein [Rhizobium sp.]